MYSVVRFSIIITTRLYIRLLVIIHLPIKSVHTHNCNFMSKTLLMPKIQISFPLKENIDTSQSKTTIPLFSKPVAHDGNHTGPSCGLNDNTLMSGNVLIVYT